MSTPRVVNVMDAVVGQRALSVRCLRLCGLALVMSLLPVVGGAEEPCRLVVLDAETGWPVPLVELRTTDQQRFVSDNAGMIAIHDADLLGRQVWFDVIGHGYDVAADGFGMRGLRLELTAGAELDVLVTRRVIARRLGRLTGAGLLVGSRQGSQPGGAERLAQQGPDIVGCDSVQVATYGGRLFWAWGDTSLARYPLGVFHTTAATTPIAPLASLRPPLNLAYEHVLESAVAGRAATPRGVCRMPGEGPTWLSGLVCLRDQEARERLAGVFTKIAGRLTPVASGLCVWDDETEAFVQHDLVWQEPDGEPRPLLPEGHPVRWRDAEGQDWVLFGDPFPTLMCPATFEAWADPTTWQSCPAPAALVAVGDGAEVQPHRGAIACLTTDGRVRDHGVAGDGARWLAIFTEKFGKPSAFGEIWYAEASSPLGPWGPAVKVLSHDNYSFYNPVIHTALSEQRGVLLFEGTYSHTFADHPLPTPRYDYNQVLYALPLDDPELEPARKRPDAATPTTRSRKPAAVRSGSVPDEAVAEVPAAVEPPAVLEVTTDITLDPQQIYGQIVVKKSGVVIEGRGAVLRGPKADAPLPQDYAGVAVLAEGVHDVTLRGITARGWETGLVVRDATGWLVEDCDFSDNFHDPSFGWGENGRRGGILLERVCDSTLRRNRANRVWDGCVLVDSNDNLLEDNDFSHTSNTCLKLWTSCRNTVRTNTLTHGIRIDPGEVHARDSTCVLIESGSDDNRFLHNDCTHGGDGIFVRVLNGWNSSGNLFQGNDCSHANNNGFECWAPGNTFLGNTANHCSYGFWLGGSDRTRLIGNEASFNGLPSGPHNSPHLPGGGHAGIVFMFGSSSHVLARGNRCQGNQGAGIALVGDLSEGGPSWKATHWVLQDNHLLDNRQGVYIQHADWVVLDGNHFEGNATGDPTLGDVVTAGDVTRLVRRPAAAAPTAVEAATAEEEHPVLVSIAGPSEVPLGEEASFGIQLDRAVRSPVGIQWDTGDGHLSERSTLTRSFADRAGVASVAANVLVDGQIEPLAMAVFVTRADEELGTEPASDEAAAEWSITDYHDRTRSQAQVSRARFTAVADPHVVGRRALGVTIEPYAGFRVALTYPAAGSLDCSLEGVESVSLWLKAINADRTGWQGGPFVILHGTDGSVCHLEPAGGRDLMRELQPGEKADDWRLLTVPLKPEADPASAWQRTGVLPGQLRAISIAVDSWGAPPLQLWLDGLSLHSDQR